MENREALLEQGTIVRFLEKLDAAIKVPKNTIGRIEKADNGEYTILFRIDGELQTVKIQIEKSSDIIKQMPPIVCCEINYSSLRPNHAMNISDTICKYERNGYIHYFSTETIYDQYKKCTTLYFRLVFPEFNPI